MKTAPVKTDNGSFNIISFTECQEALSERQFGKQTRDRLLTLSGAYVRAQSVGIYSYTYWDFTDFFRDISSYNET